MKTFIPILLSVLSTGAFAQEQLLIDLNPGSGNANPSLITVVENHLYFNATDGQVTGSLFKSDGTAEGTEFVFTPPMVTLVNSGLINMFDFDGHVLFHHFNGQQQVIYLSDGTADGTAIISNPDLGSASSLTTPISDFGYHYRTGSPEKYYRLEPGTHENVMLTGPDFPEGITSVLAFQFLSCGDRVYFTGSTSSQGHEPFYSDGTHEGTYRIADLNPGSANSFPRHYTCFDDGVLFTARVNNEQRAIYRWDGPGNAVEFVKLINENDDAFSSWSGVRSMFRLSNGVFLFLANDGIHGNELWRTDGSAEGTYMVKDIRPGPLGSMNWAELNEFISPVGDGSQAIFPANDGEHGHEWHITDGTLEGTNLVIDLDPGIGTVHTFLQRLALDGKVYFRGRTPTGSYELFVTDGTEEGTLQLTNIRDGQGDAGIAHITHFNNQLYFRADDGVHGTEVWMLDLGTLSAKPAIPRSMDFELYPNPASDLVQIEYHGGEEMDGRQGHLTVHDLSGREILSFNGQLPNVLQTSGWQAGWYVVKIHTAAGVYSQKLIIAH